MHNTALFFDCDGESDLKTCVVIHRLAEGNGAGAPFICMLKQPLSWLTLGSPELRSVPVSHFCDLLEH